MVGAGWIVVHNPQSGSDATQEALRPWLKQAKQRGARVIEIDALDETLDHGGDQRCEGLVAAGGDGTVSSVGKALLDHGWRDVTLAVLPGGTANDFARGLGITDVQVGIEAIERGRRCRVDALRVRFDQHESQWCINAMTGGMSDTIRRRLERNENKARFGRLSYIAEALKVAHRPPSYRLRITHEAGDWQGVGHAVAVVNGGYAGGFRMLDVADACDGRCDVGVLARVGNSTVIRTCLRALVLGSRATPALVNHTTRRVTVESDPPMRWIVDGEPTDATAHRAEVEAVPEALHCIVNDEVFTKKPTVNDRGLHDDA